MNKILSTLLLLILVESTFITKSFGHCSVADFTLPATVCAGSIVNISNTSSGATNWQWDFTPGFFRNNGVKISDSINVIQYARDISIESENDSTFAFLSDGATGNLFRVTYANGNLNHR